VRSFSAGVSFGGARRAGPVRILAGPVAMFGYTRIEGRAASPDVTASSGSAFTIALRLRAAVVFPATSDWSLHVFAEGGGMARGFDALVDGARAAGVSGASFVVGVGGGYVRP
jgi:hypothetical protein